MGVRLSPCAPAFARAAREGCRAEAQRAEAGMLPRASARQAKFTLSEARAGRAPVLGTGGPRSELGTQTNQTPIGGNEPQSLGYHLETD